MSHRTSLLTAVRERHARRVAERTASAELAADLAAYRSPHDLAELAAVLDRHSDADAAPLRDAVEWTRAA